MHGICHKLLGLFVLDLVGEMEFDFRLSINLKVVLSGFPWSAWNVFVSGAVVLNGES